MIIKVIKRGLRLQLACILAVGPKTMRHSVHRQLNAGKKSSREAVDAFCAVAANGGDLDACFAAMEDRPDLDPKKELEDEIAAGQEELLRRTRHALQHNISCGKDANAQAVLDGLTVEKVEIVEPEAGKGICRVCYQTFDLHYIAGTDDLCMGHINPGYI